MSGETTWAELTAQPEAWADLLARLEGGDLVLPHDPRAYDDVLLMGSGTSYYLALAAADWLSRRGVAARAVPSCEVMLDGHVRARAGRGLAIGFSRSGRSSELLLADAALREAGWTTLGVTCTAGSAITQAADATLLVAEGREDGLIMLRSVTSMLLAVQWLTGDDTDRAALARLPDAGRAMLDRAEAVGTLATSRPFDRFVFLASGPDYPLAREAALKAQEMAIATSEAYHSLDYRHGPKACAGPQTLVTIFALSDPVHGTALARDMADLGAAVLVVGPGAEAYADAADLTLPVADLTPSHAAAASLIPAQILAYRIAMAKGVDPDAPANLTKVVTF